MRHSRGVVLANLGRADEARIEQAAAIRLRQDLDHLSEARRRLITSPQDWQSQLIIARWMFDHDHGQQGVRWADKILADRPGDAEASRLLAEYHEPRRDGACEFLSCARTQRARSFPDAAEGRARMRSRVRWARFRITLMVITLSVLSLGACVALTDPAPCDLATARWPLARNQVVAVGIPVDQSAGCVRTQDSGRLGRQFRRQWLRDRLSLFKADRGSVVSGPNARIGDRTRATRHRILPKPSPKDTSPRPGRPGRRRGDRSRDRLAHDARGTMVRGERLLRGSSVCRPIASGTLSRET